jgi:hypothetical protein
METKNSNNHEEEVFNVLENWEQRTVPDFFETRILSKISTAKIEKASKFNWALLTTILILNAFVAFKALNTNLKTSEELKENAYSEYLESNNYYNHYYNQEL